MSAVRKILGGFLLFLVAVPVLMAVVWATGITRGVMDESFLQAVPEAVIDQLPELSDELYEAARTPGAVTDPQARAWLDAAAATGLTPTEFFERIGVWSWLQEEVKRTVREAVRALRGEVDPAQVVLNNRPLKEAFSSPSARALFTELLDHLPQCDSDARSQWGRAVLVGRKVHEYPPCNPGPAVTGQAVDLVLARSVSVPDEVPLFRNSRDFPVVIDALEFLSNAVWFLFLAPLLLILVGGLIAGTSPASFLRWTGAATLAGGLLPLVTSSTLEGFVLQALRTDPGQWARWSSSPFWTTEASQVVARRLGTLTEEVLALLVGPVGTIAMVTSVIGLALLGFSFLARGEART